MNQVLFVLKGGQVSYWKFRQNRLTRGALNGESECDYTPEYWDEWRSANQVSGGLDALFLSDEKSGWGTLPDYLSSETKAASAWTMDELKSLVNKMSAETDSSNLAVELVQGKTKFIFGEVSSENKITFYLAANQKFALPKDEPKKETTKPALKKEIAKPTPKSTGVIGDSYNDPEALKLAVGTELQGEVVSIFKAMRRNYVKVEGLKEQVCFKSNDTKDFAIGDKVALIVTSVDEESKKVLFQTAKK